MSETTQRELAPHTPLNSMQFALAGDSTPANADVRARIEELRGRPVKPTFDAKHLHEIHNRLYADHSLTAGRLRGTNLLPDGTRIDGRTSPARELAENERLVLSRLTKPETLRGATKDQFVNTFAQEFNSVLSERIFNSGNFEATAVFFNQRAELAGYSVDLLRGNRSLLEPAVGVPERAYMPGMRKEIRRIATPESALEFTRVLKIERKHGVGLARDSAIAAHPELAGAFDRETQARHARDRDSAPAARPELTGASAKEAQARLARDRDLKTEDGDQAKIRAAQSRYKTKIEKIQSQLDAGRPPDVPDQRIQRERDMKAASM